MWHLLLLVPLLLLPVYADTPTLESQIVDLINQYRLENGLNELILDDSISDVAQGHAQDLADTGLLQHETPNTNVGPNLRGTKAGFDYCGDSAAIQNFKLANKLTHDYLNGLTDDLDHVNAVIEQANQDIINDKMQIGFSENISEVFTENIFDDRIPDSAMYGWKESPSHNQGMLNSNEMIGVGIAYDDKRVIIVTDFC